MTRPIITVVPGMPGMPDREGFWATAKKGDRCLSVRSGTAESALAFLEQQVKEAWDKPLAEGVVYESLCMQDWRWRPTRCCSASFPHVHATDPKNGRRE